MLSHVVGHMATKEDVARLDTRIEDLRVEMIDQFEHVEKQFHATHNQLHDISSEIAVIHRRVERLEELGASNAGFAKEIDHLLTRVAAIEKKVMHTMPLGKLLGDHEVLTSRAGLPQHLQLRSPPQKPPGRTAHREPKQRRRRRPRTRKS
jgi:hypothetical protein